VTGGHEPELLDLPLYEPEHRELAREISAWAGQHAELWKAVDDVDATGRRVVAALGAAGFLAAIDGDGHDLRSLCLVREVLAYTDDLADFGYSIQTLAAAPIRRFGSAEQRARWLPAMANGDAIGSFAVSEPSAGSDVAALALRANAVEGGFVLDGAKSWIAHGSIADVHCVIARTGDGPGPLGLTALLIPAGTPGLKVSAGTVMTAPRALSGLEFTDCFVPADAVLGRRGGGFPVAMYVLERARMTVGAAAIGFARRALDEALHHARQRPIYGGRLWDLPTLRAGFADLDTSLAAAALMVARAAWAGDTGCRDFARHSAAAKLFATEVAQRVVDATVQAFGAAGLVAGSLPERLYRQVRSLRIYEGPSEVQRVIIADALGRRRP
jgi:acyl-CoA dehydrogenase